MCNSPFIFCSSPAAWAAPGEKGVYFQSVQISHKKMPRLSGIIRVHSGRTERTSPITSEKLSPQCPCRHIFPAGAAAAAAHSRPIKKLSPVSMRGNSQNGGQTTKSLLIKPQCSGVPIQQAVSLSSSFPRHCLLFVLPFCGQTASSFAKKLPYSLCTAAFCYTFCFFTWRFARWFTIPDAAAPSASPSTMPPRISVGKCT